MTMLNEGKLSGVERINAIKALATSTDPRAVDFLLNQIWSMDEATASASVGSLRALKAAPELEQRLARSTNVEEKARLCRGLAIIGEKSSVKPLLGAVADANVRVRQQAVMALGTFAAKDTEAHAALEAALADNDTLIRQTAGDALSIAGTDAAKRAVTARIAVEPDTTVRISLTEALNAFKNK